MSPEASDELKSALCVLKQDRNHLMSIGMELLQSGNGSIFLFDLYAQGALNRSLSLSQGFESLVSVRNIACAAAILRMQLDTALRFYAGYLVESVDDFALAVMNGTSVRKLKDRTGKAMTDAYLVEKVAEEFEWVEPLYEKTCEFVHLSKTHMFSTMTKVDRDNAVVSLRIGEGDIRLADSVYLEALEAFQNSTALFISYLSGWIDLKNSNNAAESP